VPPDQRFCGHCGKQLAGTFPPVYASPNRVQQHVRLLGILWLALSALNAVGGLVLFTVANTVFAHMRHFGAPQNVPPSFLSPLLSVIGCAVLFKAALGFIAGWGLLRHEPWARILTIVLSFLALFNIPFGTALGIYGLWVLLPAASEREYQQTARRADAA
jgi:hypothetical protein